jgi:hypothetical protein
MRVDASGLNSHYLEIAGGASSNGDPLALLLELGQEQNRKLAFPPEQFLFATGGYNATTVTFDPKTDTVRAVFINSAEATGARRVQAGGPDLAGRLRPGISPTVHHHLSVEPGWRKARNHLAHSDSAGERRRATQSVEMDAARLRPQARRCEPLRRPKRKPRQGSRSAWRRDAPGRGGPWRA